MKNLWRIGSMALIAIIVCQPAKPGVTPESATTQSRVAAPGTVYRGSITLSNSDQVSATVKLYQTDYAFSADGRSSFGNPGQLPRSNAKWLRLQQEQLTLGPDEHASVDYEIHVPDDAQLTGSYWSTIMIEEIAGAEANARTRDDVQLRQNIRHAIQIITEIGETGASELTFRNTAFHSENAQRALCVDMENTGERWLQTEVWLELHDRDGKPVGKFTGRRLRTFPGTSVRNCIDIGATRPGSYLALLVADGGHNDLFGTQFELVVP